jgi:hypothetical protein
LVLLKQDTCVDRQNSYGCALYFSMSDPAPVRIRGLHERTEDNDFEVMTPAERVGMMWQLALDAWAFQGSGDAESRLPRDIVRIQRRTR